MNRTVYKTKFNKIAEKNIYHKMFGSSSIEFFPINFSKIVKQKLEKKYFYTNRQEVSFENINEGLIIEVDKHKHKQVYLSYHTLDNNFNIIPEKPLIFRDNGECYIRIDYKQNGLRMRPFLIFYDQETKTRLYELTEDIEKINFKDNELYCRLTFKLEGYGSTILENIELNFLEIGGTTV